MSNKPNFPLVDALLTYPEGGTKGAIGIATNTTAAGQVLNDIPEDLRKNVSVMGSLIVSRDGAERMILNSLVHPTLKYLILFSEESLTFSPSTNLLLACMKGLDDSKSGNFIQDGVAASAHYPNLSKKILNQFREEIIVLPLFMYKSDYSRQIVCDYIDSLDGLVSSHLQSVLRKLNESSKIYFDSLTELINAINDEPTHTKNPPQLDAKDFQHLQPPLVILEAKPQLFDGLYRVSIKNDAIFLELLHDGTIYEFESSDEFLLEYTLMQFLCEHKIKLTSLEQLVLGAEIGRVGTEIVNGISLPSILRSQSFQSTKRQNIKIQTDMTLLPDEEYYYRIGIKEDLISVFCLAFDVCETVFELRTDDLSTMLHRIAELDRFQTYEMDILHRLDVAAQISHAAIAQKHGYNFIQDFALMFKVNKTKLPFLRPDGDSFLDVHKQVLTGIYTQGLTHEHGDAHKGLTRSAVVLASYRNTEESLAVMPRIYQQGEATPAMMRKAYAKQLLRLDHDGSYSYGERTRAYFGHDQLNRVIDSLQKNPNRVAVVQRFDPRNDMGMMVDEVTGKQVYTHDPCLTHDLFFIRDGALHSFHIARAHNTVNAYPENIFGLYDAYTCRIKKALSIPSGDMFMLSSRANILLLTEEQRTKKLIAEPSKPPTLPLDTHIGSYPIGKNFAEAPASGSIAHYVAPLRKQTSRPDSEVLDQLEARDKVNTLEKAIAYLETKGHMHNNPVLSQYSADRDDPQGSYLVFLQANVLAGKVYITAVYMNCSPADKSAHVELCNYIGTKFATRLGVKLGDLTLFYVGYGS